MPSDNTRCVMGCGSVGGGRCPALASNYLQPHSSGSIKQQAQEAGDFP